MDITNDLLSEALGFMRITGSLLVVDSFAPPWGVAIPDQATLARILRIDRNIQVVAFHFVQRGCVVLDGANGDHKVARYDDMLVCFGGLAHIISQGEPSAPITLEAHLNSRYHRVSSSEPEAQLPTSLICGVFLLRDTHLNPLFAALPAFLHIQSSHYAESGLSLSIPHLLAHEIMRAGNGSAYAVQRLLELLCMDTIRVHMRSFDAGQGWFRGIGDPLLGKALHRFHQSPGDSWSVSRLAHEVSLSPSRFAARFAVAFGESCMTYVTKWRLNVARSLLQETDYSIDEIAHRVGYQNLPAFIRVFKRYLGISPASWRKQQ